MNQIDLILMEDYYRNLHRNFASKKDKYRIISIDKKDVENHWFIKDKDFKVKLLYDGKARYYYQTDDRGIDHLYGKSALYFKVAKNDLDPVTVFIGFDTDADTNGIGIFLGGDYDSADMGKDFDYGVFAQKYYGKIKDARKDLSDYADFAPWVTKNLKSIIKDCIKDSGIDYPDVKNPDPWDFVHIRGLDSIDFSIGHCGTGKVFIDNDIILEVIGYRIFAAKKNLYKFCFDQNFIAAAYEKALKYIEQGKFGSTDEVPESGINKEGIEVFNPVPGQTTELGAGAQFAVHVRLDGLSETWNRHLMNPDYEG